jgi:arylsulfatase A-like enzyme
MKSIKNIKIVLLFGLLILLIGCTSINLTEKQPINFIIVLTDDQRYDTMEAMPYTTSVIFDQGIAFDKAYVTTSRCCPSRSSILTGMYAHNHNVRVNSDNLMEKTMFSFLHDEGYATGLVGKYLNSYPKEGTEPPLPEFDLWAALVSGPDTAAYNDPMMNVNGTWEQQEGFTSQSGRRTQRSIQRYPITSTTKLQSRKYAGQTRMAAIY